MIIAIIQARMGSTRLPKKVMKMILGKPIISYLLERVSKSKRIDKIIVATTTNSEDDILTNYIKVLGYEVYRGSSDDVLSRYYTTYSSTENNKDITDIVRITGDCPLIEPRIIDSLIEFYIQNKADYSALTQRFAEGLDTEVFSVKLLEEAYASANLKSEREHVTQYFYNNKEQFNMCFLENDTDDAKYRITVDEPADFIVVKNIIESLNLNNIDLNIKNIKRYLDSNVNIFELNSKIVRNEGLEKSLKYDAPIVKKL
ncbi:acylneuraminate cytidylyltransferase [Sulfurimonas gotlandica GD1]|uniref:Acylneuraminate cytidylyltransferase n=1 Tax=Sulfurimonas gotlandica (strain DSM 19862 / JCM 16533 / GD1) TaxID=929558 RepID=B6BKJ2_SULGG|nr:glycosyltransferase family protein [Sulfurimonas gotlandica]EDZ62360.1 acylneuraminate cytidylyltransferase:Aminotransferase class-III [Sulfurimonas gotlandica GD1]EHP29047.1 acylneuraminate cytidylyltransferase [Sulfurimonas gotlandica GD1]